ncbi:hypothetical protein D3C80_1356640 [compost metagenome]
MRQWRALDRHFEPSIDEASQRNVAHSEVLAGKVRLRCQSLLGNLQQSPALGQCSGDGGLVALLRRSAQGAPEHRAERPGEGRGGPVHPAVRAGAQLQVDRLELRRVFRHQVADDGVGLPEHEVAVLDHRHQAVGVLRPVGRLVDHAERAAGIDRFIGQPGLFRAPQRLAHVGRVLPAPDLQHAMQSFR